MQITKLYVSEPYIYQITCMSHGSQCNCIPSTYYEDSWIQISTLTTKISAGLRFKSQFTIWNINKIYKYYIIYTYIIFERITSQHHNNQTSQQQNNQTTKQHNNITAKHHNNKTAQQQNNTSRRRHNSELRPVIKFYVLTHSRDKKRPCQASK